MIYDTTNKWCKITNPKTAGQSMAAALRTIFPGTVQEDRRWDSGSPKNARPEAIRGPELRNPLHPPRLNPDGTVPDVGQETAFLKSVAHYWSFMFVRNSWAKLLDGYLSRSPFARYPAPVLKEQFQRYFVHLLDLDELPLLSIPRYQQQWRFADGVDFIGRFDNLQGDFDAVCAHLGVKPVTLDHVHPSYLTYVDLTFADFYDNAETIDIVGQKYAKDIELYGFTPPEPP